MYGGVRTDLAAKELAAESDRITPVELDVTVPEHVAALDRNLPERLDALVNNAGIAVAGPVETLSREMFGTDLQVERTATNHAIRVTT